MSVSEAYTDNSGLVSDNEDRNTDFTTQVSPGISINGSGGRSSLNLNYAFNQTFYHRGTQSDENRNSLAAVGQVELWKRVFFIDGQAAISQIIEDGTQAKSNSPTGQNINRTEARSFNVSPFMRQHFGQWLDAEPRVRLNKTSTQSDQLENTITRTATITLNSGRRFALFPWSVVAFDRKTQNDGAQPSEYERRVDGSFSYVLDRKLTLTGTVGWEKIEDSGLNNQPTGITWSGGFTARPSSRTSLQFSYGDRNGTESVSVNAVHTISSRTSVSATYNESIQTSQQLIAQQVTSLTFDPTVPGAQQIGTINNTPVYSFPDTRLGLSENTFRQKIFRLVLSGSRRRNSFSGGGFWEERHTDTTGITETSYGANVSVQRRLNPRLNGSVGISVQKTDYGTADNRKDINFDGAASLSYQVRKDIQAKLTYNLTVTKVNNAPDDLLENAVTVGLSKSF